MAKIDKDLVSLTKERSERDRLAEAGREPPARAAWIEARKRAETAAARYGHEAAVDGRPRMPPVEPTALERLVDHNDLVGIEFFLTMQAAAKAVCLLESPEGFGTGSLITPSLLLTNNHVLPDRAAALLTTAVFGFDQNNSETKRVALDPDAFFVTSPKAELDYTLVAVKASSVELAAFGVVTLAPAVVRTLALNEPVSIIQHPQGRPKKYAVRENDVTAVASQFLRYRTDTNPGSSGAPVFDWRWRVVALHHSGVPRTDAQGRWLTRSGTVWDEQTMDETEIDWIANEGVRIDAILKHLRQQVEPAKAPLIKDLPPDDEGPESHAQAAAPPRPGSEPAEAREPQRPWLSPRPPSARVALPQPAAGVSLVVPLQIQITLGQPSPSAPPASLALGRGAEERFHLDPAYEDRLGYDPGFLGPDVPLPTLTEAAMRKVSRDRTSGDGDHVLRYHHFSVVMNKERRMQFFSACNTTRDPARVGAQSRKELSGGNDSWILDPRIPARDQIREAELYAGTDFDLGHVVRREDAYWSSDGDPEEAEFANFDTFHYTNSTPQHFAFNRANKGGRWGQLEEHIARQMRSRTLDLCLFAGPIFAPGDRTIRGIRCPNDFFKVVVTTDDQDRLAVFAFVLSQRELVATMPEELFAAAKFRADQRSLRYLQQVTELRFDEQLLAADVLRQRADESIPVRSLESLRLS